METKDSYSKIAHFLILIPHRDAGNCLVNYREKLFAAGFCGAYSFPPAAPLARISRPFSREELKETARNIRKETAENDEKLQSGGTALLKFAGNAGSKTAALEEADKNPAFLEQLSLFGLLLNFPRSEDIFPQAARNRLIRVFFPSMLCAAILSPEENSPSETPASPDLPELSFRAASLANLTIRPLDHGDPSYSFRWTMSAPVWLPKHK